MAGLNRSSSNPMRNLLPPQELLDDLCSRFVLNVPKEDLESFERILFLLEQAHWFYEDNAVEQNPSLKSLSFKEFTSLSILLNHFILFPSVSFWSMIGFYWYIVCHSALERFTSCSCYSVYQFISFSV